MSMQAEKEKAAVWRLMQEIMLFTDRPDYGRPNSVVDAFKVLQKKYGITDKYLYTNYGDVPDWN